MAVAVAVAMVAPNSRLDLIFLLLLVTLLLAQECLLPIDCFLRRWYKASVLFWPLINSAFSCAALLTCEPIHSTRSLGFVTRTFVQNWTLISSWMPTRLSKLSTVFSQMGVQAVDMPTLRKAVASWKGNPAQAFVVLEKVENSRACSAWKTSTGCGRACWEKEIMPHVLYTMHMGCELPKYMYHSPTTTA
jgi:hypothetical protein